jgi:hypothetical protein
VHPNVKLSPNPPASEDEDVVLLSMIKSKSSGIPVQLSSNNFFTRAFPRNGSGKLKSSYTMSSSTNVSAFVTSLLLMASYIPRTTASASLLVSDDDNDDDAESVVIETSSSFPRFVVNRNDVSRILHFDDAREEEEETCD